METDIAWQARKTNGKGSDLVCSFCGKSQDEVKKLIAGPSVYICDECIELCNEIIEEEYQKEEAVSRVSIPKPKEIKAIIDEYVIEQERAKKIMAVAVHNHYKRIESKSGRWRGGAAKEQHPSHRPHRQRQDPLGPDPGQDSQRALYHRRRHPP